MPNPSMIIAPIRFLKQAETNGLDHLSCWNWKGAQNSNGYGRFILKNKHVLAHRVSYEFFIGTIPDGMVVCHACDNRLCVNPHHLWIGSQSDNLKDAASKGRMHMPDTRAELNGNKKLTWPKVCEIRQMHEGGAKAYIIAKMFGVSPGTIGDIVKFKTWRNADDA